MANRGSAHNNKTKIVDIKKITNKLQSAIRSHQWHTDKIKEQVNAWEGQHKYRPNSYENRKNLNGTKLYIITQTELDDIRRHLEISTSISKSAIQHTKRLALANTNIKQPSTVFQGNPGPSTSFQFEAEKANRQLSASRRENFGLHLEHYAQTEGLEHIKEQLESITDFAKALTIHRGPSKVFDHFLTTDEHPNRRSFANRNVRRTTTYRKGSKNPSRHDPVQVAVESEEEPAEERYTASLSERVLHWHDKPEEIEASFRIN